jgi:hypothetical protein
MEQAQIQKRLKITEEQVGLLEKCIINVKKHEGEYDPRIYNAMINGYESVRNELQAEAREYRVKLGLY